MNDRLHWGIAQKRAEGQTLCGDGYVVVEKDGNVLLGIADGLGHGMRASQAAECAVDFIRRHGFSLSLENLLRGVDQALRTTRGAAASILRIDTHQMHLEFAGVGNVKLRSAGCSTVAPANIPGILGRTVRKVRSFSYPLEPGCAMVLYSDGISTHFQMENYLDLPPTEAAERILTDHHKPRDDGTCIFMKLA